MPPSASTVASVPCRVSCSPTLGPTISVPTTSRFPKFALLKAAATASAVLLRLPPASAPTMGTRIITWFATPARRTAGLIAFCPTPGSAWSSAERTCWLSGS